MKECCGTCCSFREVMKHPTYQEVLTHICTLPFEIDEVYMILETDENDMCEYWKERKL